MNEEKSCVTCTLNDNILCPLYDAYKSLYEKYPSKIYNEAFLKIVEDRKVLCRLYIEL